MQNPGTMKPISILTRFSIFRLWFRTVGIEEVQEGQRAIAHQVLAGIESKSSTKGLEISDQTNLVFSGI
jgi:hypothetical protein